MFNGIKKAWRKVFGPSLKSLKTDLNLIMANPKENSQFAALFLAKANLFVQDNPEHKLQIEGMKERLALALFNTKQFALLETLAPTLPLSILTDNAILLAKTLSQAKGDNMQLAFLLYHGAQFPQGITMPAIKDPLAQVIITWETTNKNNANFKPFLQHVYQGKLDKACEVFATALDTGALRDKAVTMLTGMKKAVIKFLFDNEEPYMVKIRLNALIKLKQNHDFKSYYDLLNTPTSDLGEGHDTTTITKLKEANNESSSDGKAMIIQNLLNAKTLDVITPASTPVVATVVAPDTSTSVVNKLLGFIPQAFRGNNKTKTSDSAIVSNNRKLSTDSLSDSESSGSSPRSDVNDAESMKAYQELMKKETEFGTLGTLTL